MKRTIPVILAAVLLCPSLSVAALRTNDAAPAFSLPDLDGKRIVLRDMLQNDHRKVPGGTVLSFFATWCGPCRKELPLLNDLSAELQGKGISVVIVDLKEDAAVVRRFVEGLKLDRLIVLSDREGRTAAQYQVWFLPTTFCIDNDGRIRDMIYGEVGSADGFRKCAEKLLK